MNLSEFKYRVRYLEDNNWTQAGMLHDYKSVKETIHFLRHTKGLRDERIEVTETKVIYHSLDSFR